MRRGDWDEARGQRLLWQPVMVAFGPNGDTFLRTLQMRNLYAGDTSVGRITRMVAPR